MTRTTQHRSDFLDAIQKGVLIGAAFITLVLPPAGAASRMPPVLAKPVVSVAAQPKPMAVVPAAVTVRPPLADFGQEAASDEARQVANWALFSGDNKRMPFVIVDKSSAKVFVFGPSGELRGAAAALLGLARGDDTVPGIGDRPLSQVRPEERTTPAGRFASRPGRNASGEDVVWVDYDAAVSMHRVRPVDPKERRLERLASNDPAQRRISYGCINVPVAFFDNVVKPVLGTQRAVVYVLPETRQVGATFASVRAGSPEARTM